PLPGAGWPRAGRTLRQRRPRPVAAPGLTGRAPAGRLLRPVDRDSGTVDCDLDLAFGVGVDPDGPRTAADATVLDINLIAGLFVGFDLDGGWLTAIRAEERCVQDRGRIE